MARYALVRDGDTRVLQIENADDGTPFPVAEPLRWVTCDDTITQEHAFNGQGFDAPPAAARLATGYQILRTLTDTQADKIKLRDMARLSARGADLIPHDSDLIARVAKVAGVKVSDLYDAALKPIA